MRHIILTAFLAVLLLSGCATSVPKDAMESSADTMQRREMQSRRYETRDERKILSSSAQVLQDLGFNIDESETKLGVLVASKNRDATEAGQVVGAIMIAALTGAAVPIDSEQKIRVSVIVKPHDKRGQSLVRATFQRVVWNTKKEVSKTEAIDDAETYQQFFDKLSQSIFLTAHEL
jgi:uncharacterized lipoprotein